MVGYANVSLFCSGCLAGDTACVNAPICTNVTSGAPSATASVIGLPTNVVPGPSTAVNLVTGTA